MIERRTHRLACVALVGLSSTLGCASLLGLTEDTPSGPCSVGTDCAPDEVCVAGACRSGGPSGGSTGSGATAGSSTAGASSSGGSTSQAGQGGAGNGGNGTGGEPGGDAGSAGSSGTTSCGDTPVDSTAPCGELPDGTPIGFPGGAPQGECALGVKVCKSDGTFGACTGAIAPGQTDCSTTADEDCDGTPDNTQCGECALSGTQYCYDGAEGTLGVGPCMQGTQVCQLDESGQGAVWGPCAGQITPASSDGCDPGNDATCNDVPNEDCLCLNGNTGSCGSKLQLLGNCAAGTTQCVNGTWNTCSVAPKPTDGCDLGDDSTCDGQANEGCICLNGQTRSCGTSGTGCTLGAETCQGGNWGSCQNNVCGDFPVNPPSTRCSALGPDGEDAEVTCVATVCSPGYYVTDCSLHVVSGTGWCSFNGPSSVDGTRAEITATKDLSGSAVVCGFSACSCRHDGF